MIMERIKVVTRQHLNTSNVPPSDSLHSIIKADVFQACGIMETWDQLACRIPPGYKSDSLEVCGPLDQHSWTFFCQGVVGEVFQKGDKKDIKSEEN